ncbi:hypothetical protein HK105_209277 [Polyrhizophydium stewartii]|uniref:Uncharacterized protein n=1 Tax=Polyrhizophydium stewartii TaxID=2732419 RepID=A0ABR4MVN2_9FUNG
MPHDSHENSHGNIDQRNSHSSRREYSGDRSAGRGNERRSAHDEGGSTSRRGSWLGDDRNGRRDGSRRGSRGAGDHARPYARIQGAIGAPLSGSRSHLRDRQVCSSSISTVKDRSGRTATRTERECHWVSDQ